MTKTSIRFNCGCKFKTDNYLEAVIHANATGHTLEVLGNVSPEIKKEG